MFLIGCGESTVWDGQSTGFLWKVADFDSYVLGTTHAGISADQLPRRVRDAIEGADTIVLETKLSEPVAREDVLAIGLLPRETLLMHLLDEPTYTRLAAHLESRDVREPELRRYRPWFAQLELEQKIIAGLPAMESDFVRAADARGQTIDALETQLEQLTVLASVDESEQVDRLTRMTNDFDGARRDLDEVVNAYTRADEARISESLLEPKESSAVQLVVHARNRSWVPLIRQRLQRSGVVIAVGVAHLIGPDSVIDLLATDGVALERVPLTE